MDDLFPTELALIRPHCAGWSIGDVAFFGSAGSSWVVRGANGENRIMSSGSTRAGAWAEAVRQARELGMLDRTPGRSSLGN